MRNSPWITKHDDDVCFTLWRDDAKPHGPITDVTRLRELRTLMCETLALRDALDEITRREHVRFRRNTEACAANRVMHRGARRAVRGVRHGRTAAKACH
jgi:hypothetical protein